jgi:regulator of protease activity HflC (stomatin/prohibitin superfamily)
MSDKQNSNWLYHFVEYLLFNEAYFPRFMRVSAILFILFGWGIGGAIWAGGANNLISALIASPKFMLAPMAAMITAFMLGAHYVQDIYELPSYALSIRYLFAVIFEGPPNSILPPSGLTLPRLEIADGKVQLEEDELNTIDKIGGPGWLEIKPGNVVVLERLQSPSNVLGTGVHFITRFQKIKDVIPLEDQHWTASPITAATKDGIEITVNDFQFRYRLYSGHRNDGTIKRTVMNPYPFSVQAARHRTYGRNVRADGSVAPWAESVQSQLDSAIKSYINRNLLDNVTNQADEMHDQLKTSDVRKKLKDIGAELLWSDIGKIQIKSEEIKAEWLNAWHAQKDKTSDIIRAQGYAEVLANEERGTAEGQAAILKSIIDALNAADLPNEIDENLWNIVLMRSAQIIDKMTSLPDAPQLAEPEHAEVQKPANDPSATVILPAPETKVDKK